MKLYQINDDDLESCEEAILCLAEIIPNMPFYREHFDMLSAAIQRVRDDYGPHTNERTVEA